MDGHGGGSVSNSVIDLTDEDRIDNQLQHEGAAVTGHIHSPPPQPVTSGASSSHAAGRLPRFGHNVIDIVDEDDEEIDRSPTQFPGSNYLALPNGRSAISRPQYAGLRRPTRPPSSSQDMDEVQFLESRPRVHSVRSSHRPALPMPGRRNAAPNPSGNDMAIDLTVDDEDFTLLPHRSRGALNEAAPEMTAGVGTRSDVNEDEAFGLARFFGGAGLRPTRLMQRLEPLFGGMMPMRRDFEGHVPQDTHRHRNHHSGRHADGGNGGVGVHRGGGLHIDPAQLHPQRGDIFGGGLPGVLDYNMAAFDMGLGGNRPPTPKYCPPTPAKTGFTRSPGQDEIVVCPNCGNELAQGEGFKQEVWVIKTCGHVSVRLDGTSRFRLTRWNRRIAVNVPGIGA